MIERSNKFFEIVVKKGLEFSKRKDFVTARRIMQKADLPNLVIERVLNEPRKVRETD